MTQDLILQQDEKLIALLAGIFKFGVATVASQDRKWLSKEKKQDPNVLFTCCP